MSTEGEAAAAPKPTQKRVTPKKKEEEKDIEMVKPAKKRVKIKEEK